MADAASGSRAPDQLWRALFVGLAAALPLTAAPPNFAPAPDYLQSGTLDAATARKVLAECRQSGPARPYYLEFVLRQLPRRGEEKDFPGRLWMSPNEEGAICRVELNPGVRGQERRFLLQNGENPSVWFFDPGAPAGSARRVTPLEPLEPGLEITAFDLERPFLYWPDARPISMSRIHSRPTDVFVFVPPAAAAMGLRDLAAVRAYLDAEYHVPIQTEYLASDGRIQKTFTLVDLKNVSSASGPEPMVKDIDMRNETTRDKTRFSVIGVALGQDFLPALFAPAGLSDPVTPPTERFVRFEP